MLFIHLKKKDPETACYLLNLLKCDNCECEVYSNVRTKSTKVSCLTCELTGVILLNDSTFQLEHICF